MPVLVGFIGPSYETASPNVDAQKLINLYPELGEIGDEKNQEVASLVSTPGLKRILGAIAVGGQSSGDLLPDAPNRGFYLTSKGRMFGVNGSAFWELTDASNVTLAQSPTGAHLANNGLSQGSGTPWTNPGNVASLTSFATVTFKSGDVVQSLQALDFHFPISPSQVIKGMGVEFDISATTASSTLNSVVVQPIKNGVPVGFGITITLGSTQVHVGAGSVIELFGETWTNADISNAAYGFNIFPISVYSGGGTASNVTFSIRGVKVTVTSTGGLASFGVLPQAGQTGDFFVIRGQLGTTIGPVVMSDNGSQVIIVDGQKGYIYDPDANELNLIASADTPSNQITQQVASNLPGLVVSGASIAAWQNVENGLVSDGAYTTATIAGDGSLGPGNIIRFDSFNETSGSLAGIDFPSDAILTGISFDIDCLVSFTGGTSNTCTFSVQIIKDSGHPIGAPKIISVPTTQKVITVGSSNDFWGGTWTQDEINNDKMGVFITPVGPLESTVTAIFKIDSVTRNIYYNTTQASQPSAFPAATGEALTGGPTVVDFLDGYFLVNRPDSQQFFFSGLADGTSWDGLDVGDKEGQPDNLATLIVNYRELWLLGDQTSEVFYNSTDPDNPFQRIQGAFIEHGIAAVGTLKKLLGSVIWVSQDRNGDPIVMRAVGHQPSRISTYPIEQKIKSYGDISKATAYTYQRGGHGFYCLNFPNSDTTWVYDTSTGLWHERQSQKASGYFGRHKAENCVFFNGRHIVGDFENKNVYELDENTFTDNGAPIVRLRRAPHISKNGQKITLSNLHLDMETGVAVSGEEPQALLRISKDYGHNYGSEHQASIGKIGEYHKLCVWRKLGQARDFVPEVRIVANSRITLISMFINRS